MAIAYFGSASTPTDNGTNALATTAVTPPGSMLKGDLVCLIAYERGNTSRAISADGGQTWNLIGTSNGTTNSSSFWWCTFNGTWGANPSVLFGGTTCNNVVMHVFRPSTVDHYWINRQGFVGTQVAPSSPFTCTTVSNNSAPKGASSVTLAFFITDDDNTWGTLTGAGFVITGNGQYRNTSGSDMSSFYAHLILSTSASIPDMGANQATLGGDPYTRWSYTFEEISILNKLIKPVEAVRRAARW